MRIEHALLAAAALCLAPGCAVGDAAGCKPQPGKESKEQQAQTTCPKKKAGRPKPYVPPQKVEPVPAPAYRSPSPPQGVQPAPVPPLPAPVTTCDPGGCWGAGGERYNRGTRGSYLNGAGRLCQRNGVWMQCF